MYDYIYYIYIYIYIIIYIVYILYTVQLPITYVANPRNVRSNQPAYLPQAVFLQPRCKHRRALSLLFPPSRSSRRDHADL